MTIFLDYIFLPVLAAIVVSSIWHFEHIGKNWNQIMAGVSPGRIILDKYLTAVFLSVLMQLWIVGIYIAGGMILKMKGDIPPELSEWIFCGISASLSVMAVQIFLSLVIRNFALPIGLAFMGGLLGLKLTAGYGMPYILPYSLLSVGMRANNPRYQINFRVFMVSCLLNTAVWLMLSVLYLKKTDVRTD